MKYSLKLILFHLYAEVTYIIKSPFSFKNFVSASMNNNMQFISENVSKKQFFSRTVMNKFK